MKRILRNLGLAGLLALSACGKPGTESRSKEVKDIGISGIPVSVATNYSHAAFSGGGSYLGRLSVVILKEPEPGEKPKRSYPLGETSKQYYLLGVAESGDIESLTAAEALIQAEVHTKTPIELVGNYDPQIHKSEVYKDVFRIKSVRAVGYEIHFQ